MPNFAGCPTLVVSSSSSPSVPLQLFSRPHSALLGSSSPGGRQRPFPPSRPDPPASAWRSLFDALEPPSPTKFDRRRQLFAPSHWWRSYHTSPLFSRPNIR